MSILENQIEQLRAEISVRTEGLTEKERVFANETKKERDEINVLKRLLRSQESALKVLTA